MSAIFGSPKAQAPDPSIKAAQDAQSKRLDKQAADLKDREKTASLALKARMRARKKGGLNLLLSEERDDAETGLTDLKTTLSP